MTTRTGRISIVLLACVSLSSTADAVERPVQKSPLSLDDLGQLTALTKPALSPDGKQAAVITSRPDFADNRRVVTLVLIDTATGAARVIAKGDIADPAFSPRGNALAWLAPAGDDTPQITMLRLDDAHGAPTVVSGAPAVVTKAAAGAGVRRFAWSPDGNTFAYLAPETPVPATGDARFDRAFEVSDSDYLGTSFLARNRGAAPERLWLIPVGGGSARMLTSKSGSIEDLAWMPDGGAVAIATRPGTSIVSARLGSIGKIEIEQGKEDLIVPVPANAADSNNLSVSAQGTLAYQHFRGNDPWTFGNNVAVVRDAAPHDITVPLDRDVSDFEWLPDGQGVLVEAPDHLRMGLWTVSLTGAVHRIDLGAISVAGVAIGGSGALAFVGSEPTLAPEIYVMASVSSKPIRLTHFNDFVGSKRLGNVRTVAWKNDGYDHEGVLTVPPDFHPGQHYPLLVSIHGGPEYSSQLAFNVESQFYAANGWLVFEPNYRGSNDRGDRYETAVIGDATAGPGRDIRAGLAAIKAEGIVDEARIAVTGYSYGGVMTSWMIGHHQDWCAAIPGGVVVDFTQYYDQSETGIWIRTLLGSPHLAGNRQKYLEQSPATYLNQARTPTLVLQNVGDPNATAGQAYLLYHALKDNGVKTHLIMANLDGHVSPDPFHEKQTYALTLGWMQDNCRGPSAHGAAASLASKQLPLSKLPVAERIKIPAGPGWLAVGYGSIWVSAIDSKQVLRIDPATNRILAKIPVGSDPELGIGIGSGFVWVADTKDRTLTQIDPRSNRVVRTTPVDIAADPEGSIAVADGSVWLVTNEGGTDSGTLTRIDVASGLAVASIPVKPKSHAVIAAFGALWVTSSAAGTVSKIDPNTNRVVGEIAVHSQPRFMVASNDAVWVLSQGDGTLARIDPLTNTVVATIAVGVPGDGGDLAVGENSIWVSAERVPLTQIDPATNRVVRQFAGGSKDDTMRIAFGSAWILFEREGQILRVDLAGLRGYDASATIEHAQ